jgi:hypothetical protein
MDPAKTAKGRSWLVEGDWRTQFPTLFAPTWHRSEFFARHTRLAPATRAIFRQLTLRAHNAFLPEVIESPGSAGILPALSSVSPGDAMPGIDGKISTLTPTMQ